MAGRDTIDLTVDPPPDLIVEVDISHPSLDKFPIYASLGIPEVWRHNGDTLAVLSPGRRSLHTDSGKQSVSSCCQRRYWPALCSRVWRMASSR